ncbi:MAG: hypothetical protein ACKO35_06495 [Planctomycetaceae bacterium]
MADTSTDVSTDWIARARRLVADLSRPRPVVYWTIFSCRSPSA